MDEELALAEEQVQSDEPVERAEPERRSAGAATMGHSHWETYVRCLFLLGVIFVTGLVSWRPSVLRLSVLLSLASPTRGESLAWQPEKDIPPPMEAPIRRRPPAEWRLGPGYAGKATVRTSGIRNAALRPGAMVRTAWTRESYNPWNWQDDVKRLRKPDTTEAAMPPQKPESQFRVGNIAAWPEPANARPAIAAAPTAPAAPAAAARPSAPPLETPVPAVPGLLGMPGSDSAVAAGRNSPVSPSPAETPFPFSLTERMELPPLPPLQALSESGAAEAAPAPAQRPDMPILPPSLPAPASAPTPAARAPESAQPALRPPSSPSASTQPPSAPVPASRAADSAIDWKNREITGAIPGAYLTVYPKLKFIGLCVPGQGYIRKYNQVAVPADSGSPKMAAADGKTPYGKYYVAGRERGAAGPTIVLSWPSPEDAARIGLDAAAVSAVEEAWRGQHLPPQTTAAGGGLKLTADGGEKETTDGGFALPEPQMEEIFTALPDGAWVFVQP